MNRFVEGNAGYFLEIETMLAELALSLIVIILLVLVLIENQFSVGMEKVR